MKRCLFAYAALAAIGCGGQRPIPPPARFDRPNRVDFVCLSTDSRITDPDQAVLSLRTCAIDRQQGLTALYALVTQSARGEVAAVNLTASSVIDIRRDIPGYTFVPVGVQPSGLAVPRGSPASLHTYVADFASHDVRVLKTSSLVTPATDSKQGAVEQIVKLVADTPDGQVLASPTDMLLAPDQNALFLIDPDLGLLFWLPIQRCHGFLGNGCNDGFIDESGIATIDLGGSAALRQTASVEPSSQPLYERLCGFKRDAPDPPTAISVSDAAVSARPRPSAFTLDTFCVGDGCHRRLLVADEALPLIHAVDVDAVRPGSHGSDALLPPLVTGVPTRDVAVSPRVPVSLERSSAETQYVYAIDASDGSVLVLENGALLNVNAGYGVRPDRLLLSGVNNNSQSAARIAVMTPTFDVGSDDIEQYVKANMPSTKDPTDDKTLQSFCLDANHTEENPARLRGVFLAVAMTDGSVRVVDIHDREQGEPGGKTPCRICPPNVASKSAGMLPIPTIVRHQARLATNFVVEAGSDNPTLTPLADPIEFVVAGAPYPIGNDGSNSSPDAPGLHCMTCDPDLVRVFPAAGETVGSAQGNDAGTDLGPDCPENAALVCGVLDPWAPSNEAWSAIYEGQFPRGFSGAGSVREPGDPANQSGRLEIAAPDIDFCTAGVLGFEDIADAYEGDECVPAAQKDPLHGDQILITSTLLGADFLKALRNARLDGGVAPQPGVQKSDDFGPCSDALDAMTKDPTLRIGFEISAAYRDHVVLRSDRVLDNFSKLDDLATVRKCLGAFPFKFSVAPRGSFMVTGNSSGFQHRVVADAKGRCVVDRKADPLRRGRARLGCTFRNQTLAFQMREPDPDERRPLPGVAFLVTNATQASKLVLSTRSAGLGSATVVPVQLRYNDVDRRLYLLDISDRGLVPIGLDPWPASVDPSSTFN